MPKVNDKKAKSVEKEVSDSAKAEVTMFIGDSNLRNTYSAYKRLISDTIGDNIYEQATTNESIKMLLAGVNIDQISKVVVGSILNEIAWRCKQAAAKDQEEVLHKTIKDQVDIIVEFSNANPSIRFVILCPLTRGDPSWIEEKIPDITRKLKEEFGKAGNDRITFAQPTILELADVGKDKVHLTNSGMKKYLETLIGKIRNDADTEEEMEQDSSDWAASTSTPGKMNLRSNSKRGREEYKESEDPLKTIKRPRAAGKTELSRIFDEIRELSKKMQRVESKTDENIQKYGKKLDDNVQATTTNTKSISDLGKKVDKQEKRIDKLMVVDMGGAADSIKFVAMAHFVLKHEKMCIKSLPQNAFPIF